MFNSELGQDKQAGKVTRRVFVAGGLAAVAGFALHSMRVGRRVPVVEASAAKGAPGNSVSAPVVVAMLYSSLSSCARRRSMIGS